MKKAYLALGSNLDNPINHITTAIDEVNSLIPHTRLTAKSSLYLSKPAGYIEQPDFINAVVEVQTELKAIELLTYCLALEKIHDRVREVRWGPRTLDVDILLYEDLCLTDNKLIIPHPRLEERDFVVLPLLEIAPHLNLPSGLSLRQLSGNFQDSSIKKLN